jgi:hypothetical protein
MIVLIKFYLGISDGLNKVLSRGIQNGHSQGLGPVLSSGHQLLNLQYTDDTLLSLKVDQLMIDKLKWALKGFDGISDLKIKLCKI